MTLVMKGPCLESSKARGYYSLYYLSLIISATNLKSEKKSQDLRKLTDRKSKQANGQL